MKYSSSRPINRRFVSPLMGKRLRLRLAPQPRVLSGLKAKRKTISASPGTNGLAARCVPKSHDSVAISRGKALAIGAHGNTQYFNGVLREFETVRTAKAVEVVPFPLPQMNGAQVEQLFGACRLV